MLHVATRPSVGTLLREWRQRRHLSQLDLALLAGISARHLSFVETGRSKPSAEMVVRLAEPLDVPLRERNEMLLAAGYAPMYAQRALDAPEMGPVRDAVKQVLAAHHPYPAVVMDTRWNLICANMGVRLIIEGVAPHLLVPPVNVLRLSLHPDGMAPRILNLREWRAHLLGRLGRESTMTCDETLRALHEELAAYPGDGSGVPHPTEIGGIAVPLRVRVRGRDLALISTVTTFGTATDITVSELSIESFFPADQATADLLGDLLGPR
jgi:transcriptional regulator with XRE-family HTH domain